MTSTDRCRPGKSFEHRINGWPSKVTEHHGRLNIMDEGHSSGLEQSQPRDDELWSLQIVIAKTGLSRSSIYDFIARGIFPRQRRLGPRRVAWLASEVRAWIASRPC